MDDLSNVDWTAPKAAPSTQQRSQVSGNYYQTLQPTPPLSGRVTPLASRQTSTAQSNGPARSNASTPANDSFANLVSFNTSQPSRGLSLQEQQRKVQEEKARQDLSNSKALDARFGSIQAAAWDALGDGRTTPNRITAPPTYTATSEYGGQKLSKLINKPFAGIPSAPPQSVAPTSTEDDDLLAAFSAAAPVDKSSHMPDVSKSSSASASAIEGPSKFSSNGFPQTGVSPLEDLGDDPFGLGTTSRFKAPVEANSVKGNSVDDDDVLGLLSRPISEFPKPVPTDRTPTTSPKAAEIHPQEKAITELVDMGFPSGRAKTALESTETGTDVQAAVGWLLNQAHEESRNTKQSQTRADGQVKGSRSSQAKRAPGRRKSSTSNTPRPAWKREQDRASSQQARPVSKSPVNGDKDPTQYATEIGSKVFKTAGSLWKTGTKKLNQAVSEFNSDSDSSQPKWMRDAQPERQSRESRAHPRKSDLDDGESVRAKPPGRPAAQVVDSDVTDEALMLEADSRPRPRKSHPNPTIAPEKPERFREPDQSMRRLPEQQALPTPKFMQQNQPRDTKAKLSKQAIEEETAQAYISPARRRRPAPQTPAKEPEPDLLIGSSIPSSQAPSTRPKLESRPVPISASNSSLPSRPPPPKRNIPSLSPFALQASTKGRQEGNAAFKRGDYAQATIHYSSALQALPSTHPLTIVVFTNRALSHSKTGDPKASIADAQSALNLIGSSRGAGEIIDLGGDEGTKQMSTYWEKAMTRHAEALEHLERWSDAASTWRTCVEASVGGSTAIAGRTRCEKAAAPAPKATTAAKKPPQKLRPKPTALGDLAPDSESVTRLRAANAAADRLDDEKFALADVVDGRVSRWRAGKEGNLRALLSTLENVLWEDSGWKKVGMGDVLLPGKVKLVYMKGIAKVHPDKVSSDLSNKR